MTQQPPLMFSTMVEGHQHLPRRTVTSLFVLPGDPALVSVQLCADIYPSSSSQGDHLVCFVSIPLKSSSAIVSRALPHLPPENTGRIIPACT